MKTFGAVILNSVAFFAIWLGSSFLVTATNFLSIGVSGIDEYLRLGVAWFICPSVGGFYAPKVTMHFVKGANLDSVISSFITIISIIFILLISFKIFLHGTQYGGSIGQMFQLAIQYSSMVIGTLIGKASLKGATA